jgi:hypothetical protein
MAKSTDKSGGFDMEKELAQLTPQQAELFLRALELTMKKRRMMLFGYLAALLVIVGGLIGALYVWAAYRQTMFITWVFLVPFACAGGLIILFGKAARRIGKSPAASASSSAGRDPASARRA